jgi:rfaE bifunctional protein nucleotidyltransferase chain/domain
MGDYLLVLVNDDASIKSAKGERRPVFKQIERMRTLEMLTFVDWVIPFYGENPLYLLEQIQPHFHIKGGSFIESRIAEEKRLIELYGGQFKSLPLVGDFSSTRLLNRVLAELE